MKRNPNSDRDPSLLEAKVLARIESYLEDVNVQPDGRALGVFSASELGDSSGKSLCGEYPLGCARLLYYRYTSTPPEHRMEPRIRRICDTGTAVHGQLQAYLHDIANKSKYLTFQDEVAIGPDNSELAREYEIVTTLDGILTIALPGKPVLDFILELKTISGDQFKTLSSPLPKHVVQLNIYMACTEVERGVLIYYNKNDSSMLEFPIKFDPLIWSAVVKKIEYVREMAEAGKLPEREKNFFCRDCKYLYVCKPKGVALDGNRKVKNYIRKADVGGPATQSDAGTASREARRRGPIRRPRRGVGGAEPPRRQASLTPAVRRESLRGPRRLVRNPAKPK